MTLHALSANANANATNPEKRLRSSWVGPSLLATSDIEKEWVYRFRYQMYSRKRGRYLMNAPDSSGRTANVVVDSTDDRSLHLYSRSGGRLNGAITVCFGPFPRHLQQRIQMKQIEVATNVIPAQNMAYISRLVVDNEHSQYKKTALSLMDDAYWLCNECGIEIAFAHGVKATARYFARWGFLPYGEPFDLGFPKKQHPIVSVPGNWSLLSQLDSPLIADRRWSYATPAALAAFAQLTTWLPLSVEASPKTRQTNQKQQRGLAS